MTDLVALLKSDPNAASAYAAIASAVAAFCSLLVSIVTGYISHRSMTRQHKHNELSVRPLAEVMHGDYEDSIWVKIRNNGIGPMIIAKIDVTDGNERKGCLIDWMPQLPGGYTWDTFSKASKGRTLEPSGEIVLLKFTVVVDGRGFASCRDAIRKKLAPLTISVAYTDIYNKVMPICVKRLKWFGRHGG